MNLHQRPDTLTECDREPIHHIAAIQPFGGLIAARSQDLFALLARVGNDNAQGEYYLTDVIAMAVADGLQAGPNLVVAISVGARDGIRNGHVMSIWNEGTVVPDTVAHRGLMAAKADKVQLPDEFVGNLMVFRTFDKVAYALVMDGIRPVQHGDVLKHPDATE